MELTRQEILNHQKLIEGLDGYMVVVKKAEENVTSNPDIAIEACKSLIEGLCLKALSLVNEDYMKSKQLRKRCKNDLSFLTAYTFENVYTNFVETKIHHSLSELLVDVVKLNKFQQKAAQSLKNQTGELVSKISGLRNERGDISHGRIYPKTHESSPVLAKSILSITDGVCSFMIDELASLFKALSPKEEKLVYEDHEEFNSWIDEKHQVTTLKIDYSKILYEFAYDKYEELFYGDYLEREELVEYIAEWSKPVLVKIPPEPEQKEQQLFDSYFDAEEFWSFERIQILQREAVEMELNPDKLIEILNEMYFTEKPPLNNIITKAMNKKPPLLEYSKVVAKKIREIEKLAQYLLQFP